MNKLRKPRALQMDSTLGLIAPAFAVGHEQVQTCTKQLAELGFKVSTYSDIFDRSGYFAGDDTRRSKELMRSVRDPNIDALLCVRGGYGTTRIIDSLDPDTVSEKGKSLVGYSDITALLLWQIKQVGLVGFHGPMFESVGGLTQQELVALRDALTGSGGEVVWNGESEAPGSAEGPMVGGSLTMLSGSIGTPWEVETEDAILLFEEVGEKPYAIDRMIRQLDAAGKLKRLVGVGVGHLVDCFDMKNQVPDVRTVIRDAFLPLGIPIVFGLPFGHAKPNLPWPMGVRARLDGDQGELRILEPGVA